MQEKEEHAFQRQKQQPAFGPQATAQKSWLRVSQLTRGQLTEKKKVLIRCIPEEAALTWSKGLQARLSGGIRLGNCVPDEEGLVGNLEEELHKLT